MTVRLLDPRGMMEQEAYHHVAVARGTTWVTVAGQVGRRGGEGRRRWGTSRPRSARRCAMSVSASPAPVPASRTWSG